MASDYTSRSFLSGDLIWGVKRSDPLHVVNYHRHHLPVRMYESKVKPQRSRFLSEEPSTYLR